MTSMAPAVDVKAITALVIESLRNDVAAAVAEALRQQQEDGATARRSRSQCANGRNRAAPDACPDPRQASGHGSDKAPANGSGGKAAQRQREGQQQSPAAVGRSEKHETTTESALLAMIAELRGTIRDLRLEIAALRKHKSAKEKAAPAAQRQREMWPASNGDRDAPQRTRLAQPTTRPTYAEAALSSSRRTRVQFKAIARKEVPTTGIPLQPVAEELQRTAEKGGYGAVLPARPYRDRDLANTGMVQLAPAAPLSQWPPTLKKVLPAGKTTEDAWAAASEALATHKGLQEIAAIVNVGHPCAAPAIAGLLKLTGWSRDDLTLTGGNLSVTATSRSS